MDEAEYRPNQNKKIKREKKKEESLTVGAFMKKKVKPIQRPYQTIAPFMFSIKTKEKKFFSRIEQKLLELRETSKPDDKIHAKKLYPGLPSHDSVATILSFTGSRQEVFWLLLHLSATTRRYLVNHELRLAPIFTLASTVLERFYSNVRNCGLPYLRGIEKRKALGSFNFLPIPQPDGVEVVWKQRKYCKDQHEYEGEWSAEKDERHGRGVAFLRWGYYYEGYWKDNKMEGRGRLITSSGSMYIGDFVNDQRHGTGTFTWGGGRRYEGELQKNVHHGFGRIYSADGVLEYEGQWANGKKHGQGVMRLPNGMSRRGIWNLNKLDKWVGEPYGEKVQKPRKPTKPKQKQKPKQKEEDLDDVLDWKMDVDRISVKSDHSNSDLNYNSASNVAENDLMD